jgi:hypothetical protein
VQPAAALMSAACCGMPPGAQPSKSQRIKAESLTAESSKKPESWTAVSSSDQKSKINNHHS